MKSTHVTKEQMKAKQEIMSVVHAEMKVLFSHTLRERKYD